MTALPQVTHLYQEKIMSDIKKFEEMLDRLVNEDKEGAQELFHEIVVEKSRDIYESLLEDDLDDEAVDEATDEEVDESEEDKEVDEATDEEVDESDDEDLDEASDDEKVDEDFNLDEFEVEADPMAMGGDAGDDMKMDVEMPAPDAMDGGEEGEEELEDRVMDLEDALDDLKAEFDKMMSDEDGEGSDDEENGDDMDDMDMDMGGDDAEDDTEEESVTFEADAEETEVEEGSKEPKTATEQMREYVEKVAPAKMGDNGANTKSTVAGKNDMGGTASNLVSGGEAKDGNHAGLADINAKEENAGNVNVPGAKGATKMAGTKGHGAEKKGAGETAANTKSITS